MDSDISHAVEDRLDRLEHRVDELEGGGAADDATLQVGEEEPDTEEEGL